MSFSNRDSIRIFYGRVIHLSLLKSKHQTIVSIEFEFNIYAVRTKRFFKLLIFYKIYNKNNIETH